MNSHIQEGDKVSWNWGGSRPSGTAAEVKPGEVTVTSHRGNEISKNGIENNPAVHIERSGNGIVKTANELNVVKKAEENQNSNQNQSSNLNQNSNSNFNFSKIINSNANASNGHQTEHKQEEKKEEPKPQPQQQPTLQQTQQSQPEPSQPKPEEKKEEEAKKAEPETGDKRKADEQSSIPSTNNSESNPGVPKMDGEDAFKKQKTENGTVASAPSATNGEADKKKPGRLKTGANGEKKEKRPKKEPTVGRAQRKTRSQGTVD